MVLFFGFELWNVLYVTTPAGYVFYRMGDSGCACVFQVALSNRTEEGPALKSVLVGIFLEWSTIMSSV
ncbi:hypothetical protein ACJZTR_00475 [Neorickettsia risticii]|uniref:Uncharacterized protein n=1 Tax=Neorickettsia risticii (strain Illinois) TaxID=434131 RepID=C6V3Z6_NEORI|nr:hypothetical protein NRI_0115 [Neorickettsia risticii str. Illinois]